MRKVMGFHTSGANLITSFEVFFLLALECGHCWRRDARL